MGTATNFFSSGSEVDETIISVNSVSALQATEGIAPETVYLDAAGRSGFFRWSDSDLSTEVTNDPGKGVYVPLTGTDGSGGAWVRDFNGAIFYPEWFGAVGDSTSSGGGTDDTIAIQNCVTAAGEGATISVGSIYRTVASITPELAQSFVGTSSKTSGFYNGSSNWVFEKNLPAGSSTRKMPEFYRLGIYCTNGIKFNEPTTAIPGSDQEFAFFPKIESCLIDGAPGSEAGIGVQWTKVFDGAIVNSEITGFDINIDFHGSDICSIRDNRIERGNTAFVKTTAYGTFGSQVIIDHNDMVLPRSGLTAFIDSGDRSPIIINNYFESTDDTIGAVIKFEKSASADQLFYLRVQDNRIGVDDTEAAYFLDFQDTTWQSVYVRNNPSVKGVFPDSNVSGSYDYYYNVVHPRFVVWESTENNPFTNLRRYELDEVASLLGVHALWSPQTTGLGAGGEGQNLEVEDNAFVFDAVSGPSVAVFRSDNSGTFAVNIIARSNTAGQELKVQPRDDSGGTILDTVTLSTSTVYKRYHVFTGQFDVNSEIRVYNEDTANGGKVYVRSIILDEPSDVSISELTDSTGGVTNDNVVAISGSGADTLINNNFAELTEKINAIRSVLRKL